MIAKEPNDLTILLVEDSDDTRYFMRLELENCGYKVIEAPDGQKAIDLALEENPDIILMDLSLPKVDGIEAARQIRLHEALKKVPIIAITAHHESTFRKNAADSGFDAYVTKPFDMNFLSELISGLRFID
jgi:two-component system cell cycle response regulator DivK